ncbi:MAG TPA: xanthine dehydrogenase accessory protein XdhC [Cellvibrio sp.]|nr:xanthine dehydrogenase accessory protein XdhC [Cellvibrio sp.]
MKHLNWSSAIQHCQQAGRGYVIATIINTQGSTPRDGGSKMVVDAERSYDTIGGGQLEFLIVQQARELLEKNQSCQVLKPFPLAAEAAQCCGGHVTVMLECFAARDWQVVLFGAGHVSQALVAILAGLPCQVRIVDSRADQLVMPLPVNCRFEVFANPVEAVASLADNAWVVVFTHDHGLDFQLCSELLRQDRWRYVGLIGSATKALRFRKRLADAGFDEVVIRQLYSPIGLPEVKGKLPMEVAVSIAAQLQALYYQHQPATTGRSTSWREIKNILQQPGQAIHSESE